MGKSWPSFVVAISLFVGHVPAQKLGSLGTSGGNGPKGGLGTREHPVRKPLSFVTDALISAVPNTTRQLAPGVAPILLDDYPDNANHAANGEVWNVTIDTAQGKRQEMLGFGHSWTDSAVHVLNTLDDDVFDQVMDDLFGQNGNNMGLMRHTIGASDLSYDMYTYDDNGPGWNSPEVDKNLSNFALGYHGERMADIIAKMGKYKGDVTLFGSPWSAPGWMKRNGLFIAPALNVPDQGNYCFGNNTFDFHYVPQYAQYFAKYIEAFAQRGVDVNAITFQNEPLTNQGGYPTMWLDPADEASLALALAPLVKDRNVGIWAYDHNTDQPAYPQRVVDGAPGLIQGSAWHCYAGPEANYSMLADFHYANPDLLQFMTECSNYKPEIGEYNFKVADNFIRPVQQFASGAAMWVMATDPEYGPHSPYGGCDGCSGSIIVNTTSTYTKTNDYFMVGQFSRFVRRGSFNFNIIEGNAGTPFDSRQFYAMSVQNPDDSWAVVFMNNYNQDQNVLLKFTDDEHVWSGLVPNGTVTTWVLPPLPPK